MKKKFVSLLCAGLLAMALPTLAWAANSPSNTSTATDSSSGVSVTVSSEYNTDNGGVQVETSSATASNYQPPSSGKNDVFVATFEITTWGNLEGRTDIPATLVFNVGSQYSGMTARIYVQHEDGTTENTTRTVSSDGSVSFSMDRLSYVTIAIEEGQTVASSSATSDTSSTSPQTGIDVTGVCGITATAVVAAVGVALVLRKKVNE